MTTHISYATSGSSAVADSRELTSHGCVGGLLLSSCLARSGHPREYINGLFMIVTTLMQKTVQIDKPYGG